MGHNSCIPESGYSSFYCDASAALRHEAQFQGRSVAQRAVTNVTWRNRKCVAKLPTLRHQTNAFFALRYRLAAFGFSIASRSAA